MATKRRIRRDANFYRQAVKMLRPYSSNFNSAHGYVLNKIDEWTPTQKSLVTRYYKQVRALTARPVEVLHFRDEKRLRAAQKASQHDNGFPLLKVAFIPKTTDKPVQVRFTKKMQMEVEGPNYERIYIPLDSKQLARRTEETIQKAINSAPKSSQWFTIQTGMYELPGAVDAHMLRRRILDLMSKYDGKSKLPRSSGNRGDNPKYHKWSKWLNGIIVYSFKGKADFAALGRDIRAAKKRIKAERRSHRRKLK